MNLTATWAVIVAQAITFAILGARFLVLGEWRLGVANLGLGVINLILWSGGVR